MTLSIPADALALRGKLFRGFADSSRLAILESLRDGGRTVSEIVETTGLSQPNVSNHLSESVAEFRELFGARRN